MWIHDVVLVIVFDYCDVMLRVILLVVMSFMMLW